MSESETVLASDFDISVFNTSFEAYIDYTMQEYENKQKNKLDMLNNIDTNTNTNTNTNINTNTNNFDIKNITNIKNNTVKAWNDVFSDIKKKKISFDNKNNLFYISITLFIVLLFIYILIL
jgi:hypothetical protein